MLRPLKAAKGNFKFENLSSTERRDSVDSVEQRSPLFFVCGQIMPGHLSKDVWLGAQFAVVVKRMGAVLCDEHCQLLGAEFGEADDVVGPVFIEFRSLERIVSDGDDVCLGPQALCHRKNFDVGDAVQG
mmetsp:Transcript_64619/g.140687  ORF Transcript_64619/g.140687 Transcript_64619/m.140687 type:complete len:129 (-) Transcript_64619:2193-2579(-)